MRLFAKTVFEHVRKQIEEHVHQSRFGQKLLCMVPSVPPKAAVDLADSLIDYCAGQEETSQPLIKIADQLCREWEMDTDSAIRDCVKEISEKGWRDEQGNLTSYRNIPVSEDKFLPVLLIGVDKVTDSSSLADFHHCDFRIIWEEELHQSFAPWVQAILDEANVGFEDNTVAHFDSVLRAILERGVGDVLQISTFLEKLDLNTAQDGRDAEDLLLRKLSSFSLPLFTRYKFSGRRAFGPYIDAALSFFSYNDFLEKRAQDQALKTIDKFVEHNELGELFDQSYREPFDSDEAFINVLKHYIETGDSEDRDSLKQCDFVTISDHILGFKGPREPRKKMETVKKLSGGPVEVILTGLWNTFAEFKKTAANHGVFAHETLKEIRIESRLFKHNFDGESADERNLKAREYLTHLLGGVDYLLENWIDLANVLIKSKLVQEDVNCQSARTAEPFIQFSVALVSDDWSEPVEKHFAWRLPDIEPYRVAYELIRWSASEIKNTDGYCLPVFHLPYHEELMLAKDDEETRRILLQCIQDEKNSTFNMLAISNLDRSDPLLPLMQKLAFDYDKFIQNAQTDGLHASLFSHCESLRQSYEEVCDAYLREPQYKNSPLATLLYRAFLIIQQRSSEEGERWIWEASEPSGVVTILHPSMLEMLQAHISYLFTCFCTAADQELKAPGTQAFREVVWQNYVDLAAIQMPLFGLIKDRNRVLDMDMRGENLIHRIGNIGDEDATLTTRLLLRYDAFDDGDVSDATLFTESRESILIFRILQDYCKLHPHAYDGLSIAIYQKHDIQPVIAAVNLFLKDMCERRDVQSGKYAMSVTIFTESSDDSNVSRWVNQWRERWEAAETQSSLAYYRQSHLSVAHRLVSSENYYQQFRRLISAGLEIDIAILNGFIGAGAEGNDFQTVSRYDVTSRTLKFPILEKTFCAFRDPGRQLQRARILSNRQFSIATRHAEVMARLKSPEMQQDTHHVVRGFGDYSPWQGVVDELHQCAEWVVCIDPNIDERLVALKRRETQEKRDIIGFGSGVGSHGGSNYTISTEQFRFSDVLHGLTAAIGDVYSEWPRESYKPVAQEVLAESRRLSGLSLVRATGIGQYIRDFMAYSLTRKLLTVNGDRPLCDQLVSLDAYQHWFDSSESGTRPDLLWITAHLCIDGRLHLDLRMVECKLANQSEAHLDKARQQLDNGLQHLVSKFKPRREDESDEDDRPDQRYWWLQLHRLIASKVEITQRDEETVLAALERLAEGDYDIEWRAAAVSFWTDQKTKALSLDDEWSCNIDGQEFQIGVISSGSDFVQRLCTSQITESLPWKDSTIRYDAKVHKVGHEARTEEFRAESEEAIERTKAESRISSSIGRVDDKNRKSNAIVEIVETDTSKDRRILIGKTTNGSRPVYWEFWHKDLNNRHILLFGASGMGKTYTIQCLLSELGQNGQNSLIVDYTNGFFDNQLEQDFKTLLKPMQHIVRKHPLEINPFRQQVETIGDEFIAEGEANTAQRISGVFSEVYNLGDQQKSVLYQAIKNGISYSSDTTMTLVDLIPCLEEISEERGTTGTAARSLISKIRPFIDQNPFGQENVESWERLFTDSQHRCHVLQLAGFLRDSSRLITEFSLIDLYWYYRGSGTEASPRVLVLDEIQNLDHREETPLAQLLREGRKFGFSLILATQTMSNLEKDQRDRLFNAAHKLFFRPTDTELRTYADIAAMTTGEKVDTWKTRLASLKKGECYSLGPSLNEATGRLEPKAFRVQVIPLGERGLDG